jgi:hypothetical protein
VSIIGVDGWFSLVTKRHTVIHILKKKGYDLANVKLSLYKEGDDEERVKSLRGVTYNLENGKLVSTKLEKSGQFKEKLDKNNQLLKFTLPKVKEGSIIEYDYELTSPFITVPDSWYFQRLDAPVLWSEYSFGSPGFFGYHFFPRGYHPFFINETSKKETNFTIMGSSGEKMAQERLDFAAPVTNFRWVMVNLPELKMENFTSSLMNHISAMDVQLAEQGEPLKPMVYRTSWPELMNGLLKNNYFYRNNENITLPDELKASFTKSNTLEKAKAVYNYVRDNFINNGKNDIYDIRRMPAVFLSKEGSGAEINLMLISILRDLNVEANPVLLSTTEHGIVSEASPMLKSLNYLIVQFIENGKIHYLDASVPQLPFDQLPLNCYNGHARVVNNIATPMYLNPDKIKESKLTSFLFVKNKEHILTGAVTKTAGRFESLRIREQIKKEGKDEYFKGIQDGIRNMKISNLEIQNLNDYEKPVIVKYDLYPTANNEDLLYITPFLNEALGKNPFPGETRLYPIEMSYLQSQEISATIEVPDGYMIDELPKSFRINYDKAGGASFDYLISESENIISFRGTLKINKTNFPANDYFTLRDFFAQIVKKQNEPIVFKKKD